MSTVNKAILIGRLGKDPESYGSRTGSAVVKFSVATENRFKDSSGNHQKQTEWHNVICFGKIGDLIMQYLTKGSMVYVEGRMQTQKWVDKDGVEKYATNVVAHTVQFLSANGGGQRDTENTSGQAADFGSDDIPF